MKTSYTYDGSNRVVTQTDSLGTVTTYTYDTGTDNVVSAAVTSSLPGARTTQTQYDFLGHVTATLDGVGSAAIAAGRVPRPQFGPSAASSMATTWRDVAPA